jgi:excisionase family DNA binding protein
MSTTNPLTPPYLEPLKSRIAELEYELITIKRATRDTVPRFLYLDTVARLADAHRRIAHLEAHMTESGRYCTPPEAARMLGVHPQTVRTMIKDGRLTGVRSGDRKVWKVDMESVDRLAGQAQES